jgi:hypothetical protein
MIKAKGFENNYQLKMDDEGLVLVSNDGEIVSDLFHCMNEESLVCEFCGKNDCSLSCDESQTSSPF